MIAPVSGSTVDLGKTSSARHYTLRKENYVGSGNSSGEKGPRG